MASLRTILYFPQPQTPFCLCDADPLTGHVFYHTTLHPTADCSQPGKKMSGLALPGSALIFAWLGSISSGVELEVKS